MALANPRLALLPALALALAVVLPGAGSAAIPDGPSCRPIAKLGVPNDSLRYIMEHGVRFSFTCPSYYKGGIGYAYMPEGPDGDPEMGRTAAAAPEPETGWPPGSTFVVKAKITMSSSTRRALGLSSRVASSTISGPTSYVSVGPGEDDYTFAVWTLKLKPSFKAALKRKQVAYIALNYTLDVTLPAFTGTGMDRQGNRYTLEIPESTAHLSNDGDFKFLNERKWTPKCKSLGQDVATGCPGAP